jgi:hypothetical protein
MTASPEQAFEIARLRARVDVLERALERRSRELRAIQRWACDRDLLIIARVTAGLSPLSAGAFDVDSWTETSELLPADVEETLRHLWDSVQPAGS